MLTPSVIQRAIRAATPLNTPAIRKLRRGWSGQLKAAPATTVLHLAAELGALGAWERFVAYELIQNHPLASTALRTRHLEALSRGLADWGSVDTFGCYLAGPAWRERQAPDSLIHRWARSPDRWRRRVALVATVPLNVSARGGKGDTRRTLGVCRILVGDRDDMVVKALSWALRALVPRDRAAVTRFLAVHNSELAARVKREVGRKLRTGRK